MPGRSRHLIDRLAERRHRLIGASLARVLLGLACVQFYVAGYDERRFLWGPRAAFPIDSASAGLDAVLPRGILPSLSLYRISTSDAYFEILFHGGLIAAACFALIGGRGLALLHWVLMTSLYERNPLLMDGGDRLARILLLFFVLIRSELYLSPLSTRRRMQLSAGTGPTLDALSHNVAGFLCVFQTAVVYLSSGLTKLDGPSWMDGTAIYYATRMERYRHLPWLDGLTAMPAVSAALSYGVIALQLAYPFLIVIRRTRTTAVALASCLHLAIALKMGLIGFSVTMIAANAFVLADSDYRAVRRMLNIGRSAQELDPGGRSQAHEIRDIEPVEEPRAEH